jgi:hypothetical protein
MRNLIRTGIAAIALYSLASLGCVGNQQYERLNNRISELENQAIQYETRLTMLEISEKARDQIEQEMIDKAFRGYLTELGDGLKDWNDGLKSFADEARKITEEDKNKKD